MFQERSGTGQCCQVEQGVGGKKCGSDKQVICGCPRRVPSRALAGPEKWRIMSLSLGCVTSCGWNSKNAMFANREVYYGY